MSLAAMSKAPGECMISCAMINQISSCILVYVTLLLRALRVPANNQKPLNLLIFNLPINSWDQRRTDYCSI